MIASVEWPTTRLPHQNCLALPLAYKRRAVMATAIAVEDETSRMPVCWSEEVGSEAVACIGLKSLVTEADWLDAMSVLV
jgi:hypothetical protein